MAWGVWVSGERTAQEKEPTVELERIPCVLETEATEEEMLEAVLGGGGSGSGSSTQCQAHPCNPECLDAFSRRRCRSVVVTCEPYEFCGKIFMLNLQGTDFRQWSVYGGSSSFSGPLGRFLQEGYKDGQLVYWRVGCVDPLDLRRLGIPYTWPEVFQPVGQKLPRGPRPTVSKIARFPPAAKSIPPCMALSMDRLAYFYKEKNWFPNNRHKLVPRFVTILCGCYDAAKPCNRFYAGKTEKTGVPRDLFPLEGVYTTKAKAGYPVDLFLLDNAQWISPYTGEVGIVDDLYLNTGLCKYETGVLRPGSAKKNRKPSVDKQLDGDVNCLLRCCTTTVELLHEEWVIARGCADYCPGVYPDSYQRMEDQDYIMSAYVCQVHRKANAAYDVAGVKTFGAVLVCYCSGDRCNADPVHFGEVDILRHMQGGDGTQLDLRYPDLGRQLSVLTANKMQRRRGGPSKAPVPDYYGLFDCGCRRLSLGAVGAEADVGLDLDADYDELPAAASPHAPRLLLLCTSLLFLYR